MKRKGTLWYKHSPTRAILGYLLSPLASLFAVCKLTSWHGTVPLISCCTPNKFAPFMSFKPPLCFLCFCPCHLYIMAVFDFWFHKTITSDRQSPLDVDMEVGWGILPALLPWVFASSVGELPGSVSQPGLSLQFMTHQALSQNLSWNSALSWSHEYSLYVLL